MANRTILCMLEGAPNVKKLIYILTKKKRGGGVCGNTHVLIMCPFSLAISCKQYSKVLQVWPKQNIFTSFVFSIICFVFC